jgi:hypothetical protein
MPDPTPEHVHSAIAYAMSVHLLQHGASLRLQGLAPPQPACQLCGALVVATDLAHQLAEAPTHQRRART